jgi:hypothetical protein
VIHPELQDDLRAGHPVKVGGDPHFPVVVVTDWN